MRSIFVSFILLASAAAVFGQQTINPATQVRWPAVTGSGAPTASCTTANYGQPYTDTTAHAQYTCGGSTGWVLVGPTTVGSVVTAINGASGSFTFTGPGASCTSTTCTFSGGTVSVDGTAVSNPNFSSTTPTADSGYTLGTWKRDGSGNVSVELPTGSSADAVQYNPTSTAYIFGSFSGPYCDANSSTCSISLGTVSSYSCTGTGTATYLNPYVCTVNFASAHGLSVGDAIDMHNLTSWPYSGTQEAQHGSFQVATVPSTTQITFNSPWVAITASCSSSCGTAYNASNWAIWQFAKQPFIYGHGTVYGIEAASSDMAANFATKVAGITGTPMYYIDQTGQNDLSSSATPATVYANHLTIWAAAHTAGMKVMQTSLVPAQYGLTGIGVNAGLVNYPMWSQRKSIANQSSGQYIDMWADTATQMVISGTSFKLPSPDAGAIFARTINDAFAVQGDNVSSPPLLVNISVSGLGSDQIGYLNPNYTNWVMGAGALGGNVGNTWAYVDTSGNYKFFSLRVTGIGDSNWGQIDGNLTAGDTWCTDYVGVDTSNASNAMYRCFKYVGSGSPSNSESITAKGGNTVATFLASGALQFPAYTTAGLLCVDSSGNLLGGSSCSSYSLSNDTQVSGVQYVADSGTADVYVATLSPVISSYTAGLVVRIKVANTNTTTTPTLNVNGLGAKTIVKNGAAAVAAGDVSAGQIQTFTYDGTNFQLQNPATVVTSVTGTSPIVVTPSGGTYAVSCPTCGTSTSTAVNMNGGTTLGTLQITGNTTQACADTSGSGTAQTCNTTTTFTPWTNACIVYTTTTTNSGTGLTLNVNSLGAKSIAVPGSSGWTTTLTASAIPANKPLTACYDGTNWNVQQTGTVNTGSSTTAVMTHTIYTSTGRAPTTIYQNTSAYPRIVFAGFASGNAENCLSDSSATPSTVVWSSQAYGSGGNEPAMCLVMPGDYYEFTGNTSLVYWSEYDFTGGTFASSGNISGSRALSTVYQNTTGGMVLLEVYLSSMTGSTYITVVSDASSTPTTNVGWNYTVGSTASVLIPVPNNYYYKVIVSSGSPTISGWREISTSKTATISRNMAASPVQRYVGNGASFSSASTKFISMNMGESTNGNTYICAGDDTFASGCNTTPYYYTWSTSRQSGQYGYESIQLPNEFLNVSGASVQASSWYEWTIQ